MSMSVRSSTILAIKRTKPNELFWCCPGGGIDSGETHEEALTRECHEELGIEIKVNKLFAKVVSQKLETKGQMEYFYLCEIISGELGAGKGPEYQKDSGYVGVYNLEWLDLKTLKKLDFRPREVAEMLISRL